MGAAEWSNIAALSPAAAAAAARPGAHNMPLHTFHIAGATASSYSYVGPVLSSVFLKQFVFHILIISSVVYGVFLSNCII